MKGNVYEESLKLHEKLGGKLEVCSKMKVSNAEELSLLYSPGVAAPCLAIQDSYENLYKYTGKANTLAIVSDGSAVLGLGDIGADASLPVMEGKALLFKEFANINAIPICINSNNVDEIVNTTKLIASSFGGIHLEDFSAPRCFEIEERLQNELNLPVFHDDQHGTAIVTVAGLINSCKLTGKRFEDLKIVVYGTGAAGISIIKLLNTLGVSKIYGYNLNGIVNKETSNINEDYVNNLIANNLICSDINTLDDLFKGADVFIGVSAANVLDPKYVKMMNDKPIIFAMANPTPEIDPLLALEAGAYIIGTGRSDYPNQVNNVLAFPGIFKGALEARVEKITDEIKLSAAYAIANLISDEELSPIYVLPSPFNKLVVDAVANTVKESQK